jgi:hypothetical protein
MAWVIVLASSLSRNGLIKPFALIVRYLTPAHWWQGFNLLFELLARLKQAALPELLDKKMRNMRTQQLVRPVRCVL